MFTRGMTSLSHVVENADLGEAPHEAAKLARASRSAESRARIS
jgi:hypothetical protein